MASNILTRLFNRKSSETKSTLSQSLVTRTAAAVTVTPESALKSSAVFSGIRYHAQTVGQLPWFAYRASRGGAGKEYLSTSQFDSVNAILNGRANPFMSSQRMREILLTHAILYGNGVAEIQRSGPGRAESLFILRPDRLTFETSGDEPVYVYDDESRGKLRFGSDEVFHIAGYGSATESSAFGVSVIQYAAESIGWHRATELFGAAYFANGIHPSVILSLKNALSPEAYKLFKENLRRTFSGPENAHEPFITDGELSIEKLTVQPDESQFVESLQHQVYEIARWIGVPPSKIGHLVHAGVRANVEQEAIAVIQDHVLPWVRRFEAEADAKLFRPGEKFFTRMDLSALLRGDNQSRAEFYSKMLVNGVFSVNEVREMEDMNPIGPEGDQHLVQGQYMPLEDVGLVARTQSGGFTEGANGGESQAQIENRYFRIRRCLGEARSDRENSQSRQDAGGIQENDSNGEQISDEEEFGGLRRTLHL